jgi:APA family basic amino acid/polyamine antiporter
VWGYPFTPLVFLAVSLFMIINLVVQRPVQAFAGFVIMVTGLVVYALSHRYERSPRWSP